MNIMDESAASSTDASGEATVGVSLDKARKRLEELEKRARLADEGAEEYSQQEYVDMIEKLKSQIREAWARNERVTSLKRAIQCAKMLGSTRSPQFYPSMFVLISGVLDSFGDLVFERIRNRSREVSGSELPRSFSAEEVAPEAKETCRNWFYKIACIRELLPRIYVEMALVRCYCFLTSDDEYIAIVSRLSHIIRGIGDPMVALYCRVYLARVARKQRVPRPDPIISSLDDYLFTFREFKQEKVQRLARDSGVSFAEYLSLHSYGVEMLLHFADEGMTKRQFTSIMKRYSKECGHSATLAAILRGLPARFLGPNAMKIVQLVKESEQDGDDSLEKSAVVLTREASGFSDDASRRAESSSRTEQEARKSDLLRYGSTHADCYCALGVALVDFPPPPQQRLSVLNDVWKVIKAVRIFSKYAQCVRTYMAVLVKHYSEREVLILFKDLVKHAHLAGGNVVEENLEALEATVEAVVRNARDFGAILTSEHFMAVMDLFKSDKKTVLCRSLLKHFCEGNDTTSDPVVIHTVFDLARTLHDSVDFLSTDVERRGVASLIRSFISKIDFGRDLEQQLNVYVDCRVGFSNLDEVSARLVTSTAALAMRAHRIMKGRHNRKTAAFAKACLTYCHVTVPTIDSCFTRMILFLHCAQVALINQCLPQAEMLIKEVIVLISEAPAFAFIPGVSRPGKKESTERWIAKLVRQTLATLIVLPGHPDPKKGPFFLFKRLLNALQKYEWREGGCAKAEVYVSIVALLCTCPQRNLPYHVKYVESNDTLFGASDKEYVQQSRVYLNTVMEDLIKRQLPAFQEKGGKHGALTAPGIALCLSLANQLLVSIAIDATAAKYTSRLIEMAAKRGALTGTPEAAYMKNTVAKIAAMAKAAARDRSENAKVLASLHNSAVAVISG
jgi:hypothetical protein